MVVSICGVDAGVGVVEEVEIEQVLQEKWHREEMEEWKQRCTHAGHNVLLSLGKHVRFIVPYKIPVPRKRCLIKSADGPSSVSPALWLFLDSWVWWVLIDCHKYLLVPHPTINWPRGVGWKGARAME